MNHMTTGEVLDRMYGARDVFDERAAEARRDAWRGEREDELYRNAEALKDAICGWLDGEEALLKLIRILLDPYPKEETSLCRAVARHDDAQDALFDMLKAAVDAEEKRTDWRD